MSYLCSTVVRRTPVYMISMIQPSRTFSSTLPTLAGSKAPPPNQPPAAQKAGKQNVPAHDEQSSASTHEKSSGDDHPARQPDPQQDADRSTGFENVEGGVAGGKEGLHNRSDKPGKAGGD